LDEAREAGARFLAARFELQKRALFAWADYKAQTRMVELREQSTELDRVGVRLAQVSARTGGSTARVVEGQAALAMAENELAMARAELGSMRAMLNGLLSRSPDAPLGVPDGEEPIPGVPDDGSALRASVEVVPEVAVDVERLAARRDALDLARQKWLPDISPTAMVTGSVSQALGAMLSLPTNVVQIRALIDEAKSGVREAEARLRQKRSDRMGEYVSLLLLARDAQRRAAFAGGTLLPLADRLADLRAREYEAGAGEFERLLESRRMRIEARGALIEAQRSYEKAMVDIACCLGVGLDQVAGKFDAASGSLPDVSSASADRTTRMGGRP
jgi:outer membrane protein TolC